MIARNPVKPAITKEMRSPSGLEAVKVIFEVPHQIPGGGKPITIFDSVGFALEDFSALRYLHELLQAQKQSTQLDLIPHLADPKNLFSLLLDTGAAMHTNAVHSSQMTDGIAVLH